MKKNQTLQYDQNKIMKVSNEHFKQWREGRRFIWQKLFLRRLCTDYKEH